MTDEKQGNKSIEIYLDGQKIITKTVNNNGDIISKNDSDSTSDIKSNASSNQSNTNDDIKEVSYKLFDDIIKDYGNIIHNKTDMNEYYKMIKDYNDKYIPTIIDGESPESLLKMDDYDQELRIKLNNKYKNELSTLKLEKYFIDRFIFGYKMYKKKNRYKTICNEIEKYLKYHKMYDLDNILNSNPNSSYYENIYWPMFFYGNDKHGHPVFYDLCGYVNPLNTLKQFKFCDNHNKKIKYKNSALEFDALFKHLFRFLRKMENIKLYNSTKYNRMICKHTEIIDLKGFSKKHLKKDNRNVVKHVISLIQYIYPLSMYILKYIKNI